METIRGLVAELYCALTDGDVAWFEQHLLDGSVHIGPATGHWNDRSGLLAGLRGQAEEMSGAMKATWLSNREPLIQRFDDTTLVLDEPVLRFDDGSELPCRVTLLFVPQDEGWSLAHSHLSIGTPTADDEELT